MPRLKSSVKKPNKPSKPPIKASTKKAVEKVAAKPVEKSYVTIEKAAHHCNVSTKTFRDYVIKFPDMPIAHKAAKGNGYQINLDELDEWRKKYNRLNWSPAVPSGEINRQKPSGEKRKEKIQADLLELEFKKKSEQLIEKDAVAKAFSTKIAQFAQSLERLAQIIGYKMGLEPEIVEVLHRNLDEYRIALLHDDTGWFTIPEQVETP